jgi:hypothetical protein
MFARSIIDGLAKRILLFRFGMPQTFVSLTKKTRHTKADTVLSRTPSV